jgi:D-psicose/D-tagatose/L-ribulose 3-epimerase
MKVGMNLLLWTGSADESHLPLLEKIKAWGFDGVEFPMFSADSSPWAKLAAKCDELGLERTAVTVLPAGCNLIGEAAGERAAAVAHLKACIDSCVVLGAQTLLGPLYSPVGRLVGRGPVPEEFDRAVAGFKEVGAYATEKGVDLSIEPLNRFETYFLNTQADAAKLVKAIGVKSVGEMYDTFHANIEEKGLAEAVKAGGECINHVHISANDRATPGDDHIDYDSSFKALKEIGYDGWLVIEAFGSWIPDLAGATCIWRTMAPSEEYLATNGLKMIRQKWGK